MPIFSEQSIIFAPLLEFNMMYSIKQSSKASQQGATSCILVAHYILVSALLLLRNFYKMLPDEKIFYTSH